MRILAEDQQTVLPASSSKSPMTTPEPQPAQPKPERPRFQFSLRTLLLLFVVLGSSLGVFGAWGIVVCGMVVGLAVVLRYPKRLKFRGFSLLVLVLIALPLIDTFGMLVATLMPAVNAARDSGRSAKCAANLRQIALALDAYRQANGCFSPAYVADKTGKPMHSWRALILPYLDAPVSKAYKFAEPWNGPTNKMLLAYGTAAPFYACPYDATVLSKGAILPMGALQTSYFAVVGPNAAWAGEKPRKLADFGTDAASTVMLVEVGNSGITWAEPEDISLETLAGNGLPPLKVASEHGLRDNFFFTYDRGSLVNVAMTDGSVRCLPLGSLSTDELRTVLTIGGCKGHKSTTHEAPKLAQHRCPGRVAAFGRHATGSCRAEQEGPVGSAAIVAQGTCPASTAVHPLPWLLRRIPRQGHRRALRGPGMRVWRDDCQRRGRDLILWTAAINSIPSRMLPETLGHDRSVR